VRKTESFVRSPAVGGFASPTISAALWQSKPACREGSYWRKWRASRRHRPCSGWNRELIANKYDGSARRVQVGRRPGGRSKGWSSVWRRKIAAGVMYEFRARRRSSAMNWLTARLPTSRSATPSSPERVRKTTWKEFLSRHWEQIVAADFFTIEVWTRKGLQHFMVLFFNELSTRRVQIAGISGTADGLWTK
jgi:hypothetical protein